MKKRAVYTTGQIAEITNLSQQTIIRCFDKGKINGFKVPGSKFRRIPHESLIRFLHQNNIPVPEFVTDKKRVLLLDKDPASIQKIFNFLESNQNIDAQIATNSYDAGMLSLEFHPDIFIMNIDILGDEYLQICRSIRLSKALDKAIILALTEFHYSENVADLLAKGFDFILQKPFTEKNFIYAINSVVAAQQSKN